MTKKPMTSSIIPLTHAYVDSSNVKEGDIYTVFKWRGEYFLVPAAVQPEEQIAKLEAILKDKADGL